METVRNQKHQTEGISRRTAHLRIGALAATALLGAAGARAQGYPARPVRVLVGASAGGLTDVIARTVGQNLGEAMGQPFVVENKTGASGAIAADALAKSTPDGHTLLLAPDSVIAMNQFVFPRLPYDPNKDIQSVALIGKAGLLLVASPALGVKTAQEFIRLAKARPREIEYGSGGPGHSLHLAMELLQNRLGIALTHVPYKGAAPAMQGLLAGEVKAMIVGVVEAMPHIKAGRLVALAASGTGAEELFKDLPTLKSFHPDLEITTWFGLFTPTGTRAEVVHALHQQVNKFLNTPQARTKFAEYGITPMATPTEELDALIRADRTRYGPLIKSLGLTVG